MKLLKKLFGHLSGNISDLKTEDESHLRMESIDAIPLSEKYPDIDDEELYMLLTEKELNGEDLTTEERTFLDDINDWILLGKTLHSERLNGRSLAIQELINNKYQILPDEHGNPFKEIINFTIKYFGKYITDKPSEAKRLLKEAFPIMHLYIYRHISNQQNIIPINKYDDQICFDEFLDFCKSLFITLYPDKTMRDKEIKQHFKIMQNSLIGFIEEEIDVIN